MAVSCDSATGAIASEVKTVNTAILMVEKEGPAPRVVKRSSVQIEPKKPVRAQRQAVRCRAIFELTSYSHGCEPVIGRGQERPAAQKRDRSPRRASFVVVCLSRPRSSGCSAKGVIRTANENLREPQLDHLRSSSASSRSSRCASTLTASYPKTGSMITGLDSRAGFARENPPLRSALHCIGVRTPWRSPR